MTQKVIFAVDEDELPEGFSMGPSACFWAPPHPVAQLVPLHGVARRYISGILKVRDLDLLDLEL